MWAKGLAGVKFLWEKVLVPLGLAMADPVRAALDDFRPDVIVADQQAFADAPQLGQLGRRQGVENEFPDGCHVARRSLHDLVPARGHPPR